MRAKSYSPVAILAGLVALIASFQDCSPAQFHFDSVSSVATPSSGTVSDGNVSGETVSVGTAGGDSTSTTTASGGTSGTASVVSVAFSVAPQGLDFGKVLLNSPQTKTFTLTNASQVSLAFAMTDPGATYSVDASNCATLAAGASCVVTVRFAPLTQGAAAGNLQISASAVGASASSSQSVLLSGSGFFIPPSAADHLGLVGWYAHKNSSEVIAFSNSAGTGNEGCSPLGMTEADHGQDAEYCYEPSGAHGMAFGNGANQFATLVNYILTTSSSYKQVNSLSDLFSSPKDLLSTNIEFKQGLFYYALAYLIVPASQNLADPNFDVVASVNNHIDDGIAFVTNAKMMGHAYLYTAKNFSVHRDAVGNLALQHGANTIVAMWVDDHESGRNIGGAQLTDASGASMAMLPPNVLRGYIYNQADGSARAGAQIGVTDANGGGYAATTDASGFFQISNIIDGPVVVKATYSGSSAGSASSSTAPLVYSETVLLSHTAAATSVVDFSRGI